MNGSTAERRIILIFLQSMNIECVSKFAGWAYYRKKAVDGPFELFSDAPSKINSLKSMNRLFIPLALLNVVMGILNITLGITDHHKVY